MKLTEIMGYTGVVSLNGASLLPIILITTNIQMNIAVVMASLLMMGLVFILIRSLARNDLLNTLNCALGASLNGILLTLLH